MFFLPLGQIGPKHSVVLSGEPWQSPKRHTRVSVRSPAPHTALHFPIVQGLHTEIQVVSLRVLHVRNWSTNQSLNFTLSS